MAVQVKGRSVGQGGAQQALEANHCSFLQVTIVNPEPGPASGKSVGTQGDMEKADMVDGEPAQRDQDPTPPHPILLAPFPVTCAPSVPSGIKESVCWGPPPAASPLKSCEYHALCSRFQELLLLPGEFPAPQNLPHSLAQCRATPRFLETSWKKAVWLRRRVGATAPSTTHSPTEDYFMPPPKRSLCYCESCRKLRGDEAHRRRGEPPREYALPFGWCRFNLRYGWDRVICVSLTVL